MSINSFGKMPHKIAEFLGLPNSEAYTGCILSSSRFCHTGAPMLMEEGGGEDGLVTARGWKSRTAAQGYGKVAHSTLKKLNNHTTSSINLNVELPTTQQGNSTVTLPTLITIPSTSQFTLSVSTTETLKSQQIHLKSHHIQQHLQYHQVNSMILIINR